MTQRTYFAEGIFAEGRGPRQRFYLPWACLCRGSYPRQRPLCRGPFFAEGSCGWPSAKSVFAECPRFGPRQSLRPSAKHAFPVVCQRLMLTNASNTTSLLDKHLVLVLQTNQLITTIRLDTNLTLKTSLFTSWLILLF